MRVVKRNRQGIVDNGHLGPRETNGWPDGQWQSAGSWIVGFGGAARQRCRHCPQSGAPRACCLFRILFGMMLSLRAIGIERTLMLGRRGAGTAGCWGVGRGARGLDRPSRSLARRGPAVSGTGNAAGASSSSREVENGTMCVRGRRERPRADHAGSIMLDHLRSSLPSCRWRAGGILGGRCALVPWYLPGRFSDRKLIIPAKATPAQGSGLWAVATTLSSCASESAIQLPADCHCPQATGGSPEVQGTPGSRCAKDGARAINVRARAR